jgi:hypothetical protein
MNKMYPRRRCERCEYFAKVCGDGGVCALVIEFLHWLGRDDEVLAWRKTTGHCYQYKKAKNVQLELPL